MAERVIAAREPDISVAKRSVGAPGGSIVRIEIYEPEAVANAYVLDNFADLAKEDVSFSISKENKYYKAINKKERKNTVTRIRDDCGF